MRRGGAAARGTARGRSARAAAGVAEAARAAASAKRGGTRAVPLTRMVRVSPPAYASVSIEHDLGRGGALDGYIPGAGTLDTVSRLGAGMRGGKRGRAVSVTGPYGSGKSTMAVFLDGLLAPKRSLDYGAASAVLREADARLADAFEKSRSQLGVQRRGMIRCLATAKREPVSATILRALDSGARRRFGKYKESDFAGASALARMARGLGGSTASGGGGGGAAAAPDASAVVGAVRGMCAADPVVVVIDEFGKNVEYFTDENTREGDLFLLQELAEMSGASRGASLFVVTLQHMAFEEYAAGASSSQRREWAKVQGRFDDIPFANSPEQARRLVRSVLAPASGAGSDRAGAAVRRWSRKEAGRAAAMGLGSDLDEGLLHACYPLHPLSLEVLPELCARYGQHERTLVSFMAGGGEHTVAGFVDRTAWDGTGAPPTVMLDSLYDYFVAGSSLVHSASPSSASRLLEIETIIRDTQGLSADEARVLKAVGVLNLVGRAGRLRASRSMVSYAAGIASPDAALKSLEKRSILTYRRHSDEYRIWHGTDVDVQARLEGSRRKLAAMPLTGMLRATLPLDPVVAARHALQTGTTRIFERVFADPAEAASVRPGPGFDGAIAYIAGGEDGGEKSGSGAPDPSADREGKRPVAVVGASGLEGLREAALEVASLRDVRDNSPEVQADWVARREVAERLAWAESALERAFEAAYGRGGMILSDIGHGKEAGAPSSIASEYCDKRYTDAPPVFNEMINRNALTPQGSTALYRLLGGMVERAGVPLLGIEGWGPDRAIYEAVLSRSGIHRAPRLEQGLRQPSRAEFRPMWNKIVELAKGAGGRLPVQDLYESLSEPPYGVKAGLLPLLLVSVLLVHRDRMALYEHGTYCRAVTTEITERLVRNPAHFEIKHFGQNAAAKYAVERVAGELRVHPRGGAAKASLLDVVSHLVGVYASLTPHIKKTRMLSKRALGVRLAVETAVEPDKLLLESLPQSLGYGPMAGRAAAKREEIDRFAANLAKSLGEISGAFDAMLADLVRDVLKSTSMPTRKKLSKAAAAVAPHVLDREMKVFLTAVSNDMLESDGDWIKYAALTLTGVPPSEWSDEQRTLFTNRLRDISARFARLASMHFAEVSDSYAHPAYRVTVTRPDGGEEHAIVSLPSNKASHVKKAADRAIEDLRARGLDGDGVQALLAELSGRLPGAGGARRQRRSGLRGPR